MRFVYRLMIFLSGQLFGWGIAWLGGYDFDTRNAMVAYWAVSVTLFSLLFALMPWTENR